RSHGVGAFRRREERLGRNRTVVQTVAAHFMLFDENDALSEGRRHQSQGQAAGARANDAEIGLDGLSGFDDLVRTGALVSGLVRHVVFSIARVEAHWRIIPYL